MISMIANPTTLPHEVTVRMTDDVIVSTPGICSGKPRIAGTRIKVQDIYVWVEEMAKTPSQIIEEHPHLTHAQIYSALAYYWMHSVEIERDITVSQALEDRMLENAEPTQLQSAFLEATR
jgi:uncharacterized protein (DUF433 family)